jgi:aminopeptidase N
MKKISLALTLALSSLLVYSQKPGASIDVIHYDFAITVTDASDIIKGEANIKFVVLKETNSINLDLTSLNAQKKGMQVSAVKMGDAALGFTHVNNVLSIKLSEKLPAGTESTATVLYSGIPADGLIITTNKYKHRGFYADHWPNRAHDWLPCVDHPSDKASVDFYITAPEHYQVVANGIQTEESSVGNGNRLTRYTETVPLPTKVMVIGVADFAVQLSGFVDCIPVYAWIFPEDKDKGFFDYGQATSILPFYIKNVGPYGYKKLANVQSKTRYGGLENAGAIFYYENSVTGTQKSESLLAHEIAHQWFGDMATEKEWAHVWLSEGFATYMTILYMESVYGKDTATKMLIQDRVQTIAFSKKNTKPIVDSSVTDYMQLLNANSYQKAGFVLHMLRIQLGDSTFWRAVRTYYAQFAGKNANTEDLQKIFEETSGKNLSQFFKQWLYTPGQPQLQISYTYDQAKKLANFTLTQLQSIPFEFPIEIQVMGGADDGTLTKSIQVSGKQTNFSIPMMEAPSKIVLDPNVKLLYEEEKK